MIYFDLEALQAMAQKSSQIRVFSDDLLELIYTLKAYENTLKRISEEPGISGQFATLALQKANRRGIHEPKTPEDFSSRDKSTTFI